MPLNILFASQPAHWDQYASHLHHAFEAAGLNVRLRREFDDPGEVDYIVLNSKGPISDFSVYPRLKAVLNLWAGVEGIAGNKTLTAPLCRMVEMGLSEGMVEFVTGNVLRYHLGMDAHISGQNGVWRGSQPPPLARDRKVTMLGLGALGLACARQLAELNFQVSGWSRSQKSAPVITCYAGAAGLRKALADAEIVVLLVPLTPDTENLLNAESLSWLPKGARIINPGRGGLIDDDALLAALDKGHIAHATLDVFRVEPLPAEHRYWAHPNVTVTPHIAAQTRPETSAESIAENVRRGEAGEPFINVVDRTAGY